MDRKSQKEKKQYRAVEQVEHDSRSGTERMIRIFDDKKAADALYDKFTKQRRDGATPEYYINYGVPFSFVADDISETDLPRGNKFSFTIEAYEFEKRYGASKIYKVL